MSTDVDLVIVGAGAAGLAAAKEAQKLGLTFTVLEASHRIGGRAYTEDFAPGVPFDLGCHWMHSASLNPFVAIAEREGFHYEKDNDWHSSIFERGTWLSKDKLAELNAAEKALERTIETAVNDGKDVAIADVMDLSDPWAPYFAYWLSLGTSRDIDQVSIIDNVAYKRHRRKLAVARRLWRAGLTMGRRRTGNTERAGLAGDLGHQGRDG